VLLTPARLFVQTRTRSFSLALCECLLFSVVLTVAGDNHFFFLSHHSPLSLFFVVANPLLFLPLSPPYNPYSLGSFFRAPWFGCFAFLTPCGLCPMLSANVSPLVPSPPHRFFPICAPVFYSFAGLAGRTPFWALPRSIGPFPLSHKY